MTTVPRYQQFLLTSLFTLVGVMPLPWIRALGATVGSIMWWLNGREAKVTRKNLQLCFPLLDDHKLEARVRASLKQTGIAGLELVKVWMQPNARSLAAIKHVTNRASFEKKLSDDRGLLLVVPHLGNWEVVALWCAGKAEMTALYQPPKQQILEPIIKVARERMGNKLYPTNASGVRAIFRVLKKGGFSGLLPDQSPEREGGEFVPFYGVPALTITLVHGLVTRTNCQVIMAYGRRVSGGFDIVFKEPDSEIYSDDLHISLAALNRSVENCINDCPEQYQWEYKRFKTQPEKGVKHYNFK
jgi:KDO2-lipid IV(A) lauroyltransferase